MEHIDQQSLDVVLPLFLRQFGHGQLVQRMAKIIFKFRLSLDISFLIQFDEMINANLNLPWQLELTHGLDMAIFF